MKRPVPMLHQMLVTWPFLLIEADEQVHSRSTKGQELDMPTLEASLKLILSTNQVAGAIVEDPDLANLLVLALLRVRPLGGQIRRAIALHDRGCGCGCVWLEPRDNACMWSRVLSEKENRLQRPAACRAFLFCGPCSAAWRGRKLRQVAARFDSKGA